MRDLLGRQRRGHAAAGAEPVPAREAPGGGASDPRHGRAPATGSGQPRRWSRDGLVVLALVAIFVAQGALAIRHKSRTNDEGSHFSYGRQILKSRSFARAVHSHNATSPLMVVNALAGLRVGGDRGALGTHGQRLYAARLPTLLWGAAIVALTFAWAREAFGRRAAVAAAALATFCPHLLAHSSLVTTDALTTLGVFGATYALWRYRNRGTWRTLAMAGVALGFALVTKLTAIYLLPLFAVVTASDWLRRRARPAGDTPAATTAWSAGRLAALGALALLVVNATYLFQGTFGSLAELTPVSERFGALARTPVMGSLPLPLPSGFLQGIDWVLGDMARGRWSYCLGEYSRTGFPHYYAVALLTKGTLGFLLLVAVALGRVAARRTYRTDAVRLFLLAPVAFYFVYFSFFYSFQIGLRHLLPIFPFLFVLAGELAASRRTALAAFAWLMVTLHAASSLRVYPHYLAYFNEAVGGPLQGWRYLVDSNLDWGQDDYVARSVYAPASPVPVTLEPRRPVAGRILVRVNRLVGLSPNAAQRYAWLREHFEPVDHVGYSWHVYDVSAAAVAALPEAAGTKRPRAPRRRRR